MEMCNVTSAEYTYIHTYINHTLIETILKAHSFIQIISFLAKSEKIGLGYSLNLNYKIPNIRGL